MLSARTLPLACALSLALPCVVLADALLYTAPYFPRTDESLTCVIVNVNTKNRSIKADVLEVFSNSPLDSEQTDAAPGEIASASGDGNYCRFTVGGKSKDVRASGIVRDATDKVVAVLTAQ